MKLSEFRTDSERDINGVWEDIPPEEEGDKPLRLKVARLDNPKFVAAQSHFGRSLIRALRTGAGFAKAEEVTFRAYARAILLGWEGLIDDSGKEIPYSESMAYKIMSTHRKFFKTVQDLAEDQERFRAEAVEEEAGN